MTPMTDRATVDDLIARVRVATGPSREIDADICCRFHLRGHRPARPDDFGGEFGYSPGNIKCEHGFLQADRYTASLDAIVNLIERELPGKGWCAHNNAGTGGGFGSIETSPDVFVYGLGCSTPALALCAAFLASLTQGEV